MQCSIGKNTAAISFCLEQVKCTMLTSSWNKGWPPILLESNLYMYRYIGTINNFAIIASVFHNPCSCCISYDKNNLSIYLNSVCNMTVSVMQILGRLIGASDVDVQLSMNRSNIAPAVCPSTLSRNLCKPKSCTVTCTGGRDQQWWIIIFGHC